MDDGLTQSAICSGVGIALFAFRHLFVMFATKLCSGWGEGSTWDEPPLEKERTSNDTVEVLETHFFI